MNNGFALTKHTINNKLYDVCIRLDSNRKMTGIHISEIPENSVLNNIYVGKVETIVTSINACFVRFAKDKLCFLPLDEAKNPYYVQKFSKKDELCVGDEILVQIVREALKEKEPAATCNFSIQGKYMVFQRGEYYLNASKKIEATKKNEILNTMQELHYSGLDYGVMLRTIAGEQTVESLYQDYRSLRIKLMAIQNSAKTKSLYDKVYTEAPQYISYLKNQLNEIEFIKTDYDDIYEHLRAEFPAYSEIITKYNDNMISIKSLYNISGNIENLCSNKVWLKSGGNIIIEQLETLTFIDINTAKSAGAKGKAIQINLEAIDAILEQITLRNISGMIIIDFINVSEEENIKLIEELKHKLNNYPNPCKYIDFTKLGLVELTRKKTSKSIKEICQ